MGAQFNTANSFLYVDGGTPDIDDLDVGTNQVTGFKMATLNSATVFSNIKFAEMIMYDRLLNDSEMNQVGNYIADKYSATWTDI